MTEYKNASIRINYSKEEGRRFSTNFPALNVLFEEDKVIDVDCYVIKVLGEKENLSLAFSKKIIRTPELIKKGNKLYVYINFLTNVPEWAKIENTNIYLEKSAIQL